MIARRCRSRRSLASWQPQPAFILDVALLKSLGVTFVAGTAAVWVDPMDKVVVLADRSRIPFQRLLIATGARARTLPLHGAKHVRTLRDFSDSEISAGQNSPPAARLRLLVAATLASSLPRVPARAAVFQPSSKSSRAF